MKRLIVLTTLLTACMPPMDEETWPIYAAKVYCDQLQCDKDRAILQPEGEDCYAIYQPPFEHMLWAARQQGFRECDFNMDSAEQWLDDLADMDCQAFYLGEQPDLEEPFYVCDE